MKIGSKVKYYNKAKRYRVYTVLLAIIVDEDSNIIMTKVSGIVGMIPLDWLEDLNFEEMKKFYKLN